MSGGAVIMTGMSTVCVAVRARRVAPSRVRHRPTIAVAAALIVSVDLPMSDIADVGTERSGQARRRRRA